MFGYMGKILRVNLTENRITEERLEENIARAFLGGRGLGAKILFDELAPGIDPLSPENKLVVAAGVVTGIPFAGNCRYVIMGKSPLTNIWGETNASGFFGPELRFAGFDAIVFEGKAERPVYLWVHNGEAQLRDASHLWGKVTGETEELIKRELQDDRIRIASIGPGGENLVRYACVLSDFHHANGRTGMGAVMGAKNLKAIAVRGTLKIPLADRDRIAELCKQASKEVWEGAYKDLLHKYGSDGDLDDLHATGRLPTKNFQKCTFEQYENITGETMAETILVRRDPCFACPIACNQVVAAQEPYVVDPAYGGPEYESAAALGSTCMNGDLVAVAKANELCNKYSLDTISTGVTIAFAMECYEKGLLTKADTDGIELTWGNHQAIIQLVEKIAKREGIGDLLAEGVKRAAEKIGRGAEAFAIHIKGQEVPMHEPRGKKGVGLAYATSNRGACHLQAEHDDFFEDPSWLFPEIGLDKTIDRLDMGRDKARMVKILGDFKALYDSLSVCMYASWPEGGVRVQTIKDIVAAATGWDVTLAELMTVGERAFNLCRAFNVREGVSRKDDVLPARLMEPLPEGLYQGQAIPKEQFEQMLDYYYEFRGWDKETGIPTEEKLEELGLGYVTAKLKTSRQSK
ncbi:MAG: aldehyde ferredoxin oxidoreductase family protein [Chloroflexi bacterium]|nr:aldehyde ferredoxin oxidoreductase family protein [Chloroflexota bacterium]